MRNRVFFKLLLILLAVIAAVTVIVDVTVTRSLAVSLRDQTHATVAAVRRTLLWASGLAALGAAALALITAQSVARRLQRIVNFADRIAAGDLSARISDGSSDEIGQVATALDATARNLEQSFLEVRTGQQQLEILLNSMQEAVLAVSADGKVQWANRVMVRLL
ncbi:MAG TPA: HAMP domain-containing protein, partial [Terriglobales bacterium]|nr:HAMP domain-containing protein [Terriglobales bacterium]